MTAHRNSDELFGEEYPNEDVTEFAVKDGNGFYISQTVDNTRTVFTQYLVRIEFNDGSVETTTADSEQELKLWTEHLG